MRQPGCQMNQSLLGFVFEERDSVNQSDLRCARGPKDHINIRISDFGPKAQDNGDTRNNSL